MLALMVVLMLLASACGTGAGPDGDLPGESQPLEHDEQAAASTDGPEENAGAVDAELAAGVASVFADFDRPTSPGCAVALTSPAGDLTDAFGMADLDDQTPITPDTVFDIASVSKQFTGGAIQLLVERGDLNEGIDIRDLVDDLPEYPEIITVGDLLHHTSGLPDYIDGIDAAYEEVTTNTDAVTVITEPDWQPTFTPGEDFEYSNTNYLLLGMIVEYVDGRSLPRFTEEEIFQPLGMSPARVRDDQGTLDPEQAQGYENIGDAWAETGSAWRQTGDGAIHTTVVELLEWAGLFLGSPREQSGLGSDVWRTAMTAPGDAGDGDGQYGAGIGLYDTDDGLLLSHSGAWIGYAAALQVLPEQGVAVAVACNIDDLDAESLADAVLELLILSR